MARARAKAKAPRELIEPSLSSHSVFMVANARTTKINTNDPSVIRKYFSSPTSMLSPIDSRLQRSNPSPRFLTLEESKAALFVLWNKFLMAAAEKGNGGIRLFFPLLISETINRFDSDTLDWGSVSGFLVSFLSLNGKTIEDTDGGVTDEEFAVFENCSTSAALIGISALLDRSASALSTQADFVAALSCEASRADVSVLVDGVVARDLKVLLAGSNIVGCVRSDAVSKIPNVHGSFREVVRLVNSKTTVQLNLTPRQFGGCEKELATIFLPLATSLLSLGEISLQRAKLICDSIDDLEMRKLVLEVFETNRASLGTLEDFVVPMIFEAACDGDCIKFLDEIYKLLVNVRKIVAWEGALALLLLERIDSVAASNVEMNEGNTNAVVVMGKGTAVLRQLMKDKLWNGRGEPTTDYLKRLEQLTVKDELWNEVGGPTDYLKRLDQLTLDLSSFFNPKNLELDALLKKVKEIVKSNKPKRLLKPPKGTKDFDNEILMARRDTVISTVVKVYKKHGAACLQTPMFELRKTLKTLKRKYGVDSQLIYLLANQGDKRCSLRYDLTIPFARYVAWNKITSCKRYQIGPVFRRDNSSRGQYRELYQCDFHISGYQMMGAMGPDREVLEVLMAVLDELNIGDYEIRLSHQKLLDGMLEICGVPAKKSKIICSSIDKLDKKSFGLITKEMVRKKGLTVEMADKLGTFVKKRGPPLQILSELRQEGSEFLENSGSALALKDLEILFNHLEKAKCLHRVVFDLSLTRDLDYYTGVIFEAVLKSATQVGSIAAGGRCDNLIGMFGVEQVPAVGVSLEIERILTLMERQLLVNQNQAIRPSETQVLVGILGDDSFLAAKLVKELRNVQLNAEYAIGKVVMNLIDHAKELRIPWMVLVGGEKEQNGGVVKLIDIQAQEEVEIQRNVLVEELQRRLSN